MPILRQDQANISVGGLPTKALPLDLRGKWTTLEGGDLESEDVKTRPGGMDPQVNLGGPTTRTDATITRPYTPELHNHITDLEDVAGRASMTISYQVLDTNARASGQTVTLHGILKNVMRPSWDANANGTAHLTLVMGCNVAATHGK